MNRISFGDCPPEFFVDDQILYSMGPPYLDIHESPAGACTILGKLQQQTDADVSEVIDIWFFSNPTISGSSFYPKIYNYNSFLTLPESLLD